ncbi:MAG: M56 family metallopeptidase [Pseudomonadota bacterium]
MTAADLLWHGLVTTFWVSVLTIGVLALRKPVTERFGARVAMLLWMIPLARLLMPTLPRAVVVEPVLPPEPKQAAAPMAAASSDEPLDFSPEVAVEAPEAAAIGTFHSREPAATPMPAEPDLSAAAIDLSPLLMMPPAEFFAILALSLWGAGMMLCGALCWLRVRSWRATVLAEAKPTPTALQAVINQAAARAGVQLPFQAVVSGAAEMPQILGLRKPLVALPADFLDRFNADEQEMALVHELVHLKRGDLVIMLMTEVALALQWFNPLAQRVRKAVRDDQEAACDEAVRGLGVCRQRYAALLVKAARHGRAVPALTLDHSLKERIMLMTSPISSPVVRSLLATTAAVGALGLAAATASHTDVEVAQREARDVEREPAAGPEGQRTSGAGDDASYWKRYGTSSRDDHLYTVHTERPSVDDPQDTPRDRTRIVSWSHDETTMVLLSDPFAKIAPPPELAADMPEPPQPPTPQVEERRVEGGRWIFVPDEPDLSGFEEEMKEFEVRMEAWSARMEDFGARMEATGDAVEALAERCARHRTVSEEPKVLTERVEGGSDKVRAVCASGGMSRFRGAETRGFVNEQSLSEEERAHFQESMRGRG